VIFCHAAAPATVAGPREISCPRFRAVSSSRFTGRALALANERHHEYATVEHLLLALVDDDDAAAMMRDRNADLDRRTKQSDAVYDDVS
jgi:ATP-dependent Clp protease ATP-binding subunit ClpA